MSEPTHELGKQWRCVLCDELHEGSYPTVCKSCDRDEGFADVERGRLEQRKKEGKHDCYTCIWLGNPQCPNPESKPSHSACDQYLGAPVRYNKNTLIRVKAHIFKKVEDYGASGFARFEPEYTISECEKGEGNLPVYIISPGKETVLLGDQNISLAPIGIDKDGEVEIVGDNPPSKNSEWQGISKISKAWNIRIEKDGENGQGYKSTKELWSELVELHKQEPLFFKQVPPILIEELADVENIDGLVTLSLTDGLEKDPLITDIFRADIPIVDPDMIDPDEYMPFAPHKFISTGTKLGKSFTAGRVGKVYERPSVGGLMGFATADKRHAGVLDGEVYPVSIDEIADTTSDSDEVARGLSSFLEMGTVNIPRGVGISVRGYAILNFMCNPATHNDADSFQLDLMDRARDTVNKLSKNYEALGSRLGLFIFRGAGVLKPRSGTPVNIETQKRLKAFVQTIQYACRGAFTSLFYDKHILAWLYDPMPQHYVEQLERFIRSSNTPFEFQELIRGHKEAIKHIRGMALRQAWVDCLPTYIKTHEIDTDEILERANAHLDRIFTENLRSFQEITSAFHGDVQKEYNKALIQNLQPEYNSLLVRSVLLYWENCMDREQALIPIESLHDHYIQIRSDTSAYDTFNKLKGAVTKNKSKVNQELRRFGLHLIELNDSFGVRILDSTFLNQFTCKTGNSGKGSDDDKHENDENPHGTDTDITVITDQDGEINGKSGKTGNGSEREKGIEIPKIDQKTRMSRIHDHIHKSSQWCDTPLKHYHADRITNELILKHEDMADMYSTVLTDVLALIREKATPDYYEGYEVPNLRIIDLSQNNSNSKPLDKDITAKIETVLNSDEWKKVFVRPLERGNHAFEWQPSKSADDLHGDVISAYPELESLNDHKVFRLVQEEYKKRLGGMV